MAMRLNYRLSALNHQLLGLAVPSVIANITTPLLGLVDTAISGHLGSDTYIAAIAVGGSMFNLLYWLFGFLRMGSSGMTAIATGRGDAAGQALILYRGALVAAAIGIAMIAASPLLCRGLLAFLEPDATTAAMAGRYFGIVVWGAPAVLGGYVLTGWFLGMQSSRRPMVISIIINVVNIAVSPVLAFGLRLGLDGLAIGTLVAQWTGLVVGVIMCRRYRLPRRGVSMRQVLDPAALRRYFSINTDIMLRTACLIAVTLWFTRQGARQGELILAANALLMQLFILFSYMIDGFAYAGEALVGRYTGAGDADMLGRCVRRLMAWGLGLAAVYSILYFAAGDAILGLLTDSTGVRATARDYLPWAVTVPLAGFMAFVWDGVYVGCTASRGMLWSMASAMAVFFITYFALRHALGNHALWLAFTAYLLARGVVQALLWRRYNPLSDGALNDKK